MNHVSRVPSFLRPVRRSGMGSIPTPNPDTTPMVTPTSYAFVPGYVYMMVVWPITQGIFNSDPRSVLTDLGFDVRSLTSNGDGSFTAVVSLKAGSVTTSVADAVNTILIGSLTAPGSRIFTPGESVVGQTSGVSANVVTEYDDPSSSTGTLTTIAFLPPAPQLQQGEAIKGQQSGHVAFVLYQYSIVLRSPVTQGLLGVTAVSKTLASLHNPNPGPRPPINLYPNAPPIPPPGTGPQPPVSPPTPPPNPPAPPVKGGAPPAATSSSSTTTALLVAAGVVIVGGATWWILR